MTVPHPYTFTARASGNSANRYMFGFNGQEKDNEVSGVGNSYTAEFWQYDPRLGRRFNVDPVIKEHESPYACFANNPIWFIDPKGADTSFNDDVSRQAFLTAREEVGKEIKRMRDEISDIEKKAKEKNWGEKKLQRKLAGRPDRLKGLQEIEENFVKICDPNTIMVTYAMHTTPKNLGGFTQYREGEGMYVQISPDDRNYTAVVVHENRHVIGYMIGEIGISGAYDYMDELVAYQQQALIDDNSILMLIARAAEKLYPTDLQARGFVNLRDAIEYFYSGKIGGITPSWEQIMADEDDRVPTKIKK